MEFLDPQLLSTALTAGSAARKIFGGLASRWVLGDEFNRMAQYLADYFGDEPTLRVARIQGWRDNKDLSTAIWLLSETGQMSLVEGVLTEELLNEVSNGDEPEEHEVALVGQIMEVIGRAISEAKVSDRDFHRYEHGATRDSIQNRSRTLVIRPDQAPGRAKRSFERLVENDPDLAARLQTALDSGRRLQTIRGFLFQLPAWLNDPPSAAYEVMAGYAEEDGEWQLAFDCWIAACEVSDADRSRCLVRASVCAYVLGNGEERERLLGNAEALDDLHPSVLLVRASMVEDQDSRLAILEKVEPDDDFHRQGVWSQRAEAYISLERFGDARSAIDEALSLGLSEDELAELEARLEVAHQRLAWLEHAETDPDALNAAGQTYLTLRDKSRGLSVYRDSAAYGAMAADAFVKSGDSVQAVRLLTEDALPQELEADGIPELYAEALVQVGEHEAALKLLDGTELSEDGEVIRAILILSRGTGEIEEAGRTLKRSFESPRHRQAAAQAILMAAAVGLDWDDEAEEIINEADPVLAAVTKARHLAGKGEFAAAEALLDPFADDLRGQSTLLYLATKEGDDAKVRVRATRLLEAGGDAHTQLIAATELLARGQENPARDALLRVAADGSAPVAVRTDACAHLAQFASDGQAFAELVRVCRLWHELDPQDLRPQWGIVSALSRLGQNDEAATEAEAFGLDPTTDEQRLLLASILRIARDAREALPVVIELADQCDPPMEDLEFVVCVMGIGAEDLSVEQRERVSMERFIERFPDTERIKSFSIEEGVERLLDELGAVNEERASAASEAWQSVQSGDMPLGLLAALNGKTLTETWRRIPRRPTDFRNQADFDLADALSAIRLGAVWDPTTAVTVSMLGTEFREEVMRLLPESLLCQASVDDIGADIAGQVRGDEVGVLGADEFGVPFFFETEADEGELQRQVLEQLEELLRVMAVLPDLNNEDEGEYVELLRRGEVVPALKPHIASFVVAKREGLPIFSDDRVVRTHARSMGLGAFGTTALIQAMKDREEIDESRAVGWKTDLMGAGVVGIELQIEDFAHLLEQCRFGISRQLRNALWDPTVLLADPERGFTLFIAALRLVYSEAPDEFGDWNTRILHLISTQTGMPQIEAATFIVLIAWRDSLNAPESEFVKDVCDAQLAALRQLGEIRPSVAPRAVRILDEMFRDGGWDFPARVRIISQFIDALPMRGRAALRLIPIAKYVDPNQ